MSAEKTNGEASNVDLTTRFMDGVDWDSKATNQVKSNRYGGNRHE